MNTVKILSLVLIMAANLCLVYGSYIYPRDARDARQGRLDLSLRDAQTVSKDDPMNYGQPYTGSCPSLAVKPLTVKPQSKTIRIHYEDDRANYGENHGNLI